MPKRPRILIVEDEEDLVDVLTGTLVRNGCEVQSCSKAGEAIACLSREHFDCLVLDMRLEEGSGEDVVFAVRKNPDHLNFRTPIVVTSGHLNPEMVARIGRDIDGAFTKPCPRDELVQKVINLSRTARK